MGRCIDPGLDLYTLYFPGTPKPSSGKAFGGKLPKGKNGTLEIQLKALLSIAEVQYSSHGQTKRCGDSE